MNDVRKMIYGAIIGFFLVLGVWFSIIYISACGFTFTCHQAAPLVDRTPIPTLIPVSHSESQMGSGMTEFDKCQIHASDLVGAWVAAGYPETDPFPFVDTSGQNCTGTYAEDIQPLFVENSLWHPGALGCISCHNADLTDRSGGLDLTSYNGIVLGSRRVPGSTLSKGNDILGGGDWQTSLLYEVLVNQGLAPQGHSADAPVTDPILYAGSLVPAEVEATPTP
ncbi:MAG: hypothetical protein C3F07_16670 [Anaerolineales bacterium]|nr:hypothetical protein [Anaerolineae bacterium]PWB70469.1 MAG: hypothetical protein C3F07_16670 [Anaerolineales bacterium]